MVLVTSIRNRVKNEQGLEARCAPMIGNEFVFMLYLRALTYIYLDWAESCKNGIEA